MGAARTLIFRGGLYSVTVHFGMAFGGGRKEEVWPNFLTSLPVRALSAPRTCGDFELPITLLVMEGGLIATYFNSRNHTSPSPGPNLRQTRQSAQAKRSKGFSLVFRVTYESNRSPRRPAQMNGRPSAERSSTVTPPQ